MFSDIFLNPKKNDKKQRREELIKLSLNNVIFKNNFYGYKYTIFKKKDLLNKENIPNFYKYINKINIPVYEVLTYDVPTKFYLDCEMENLPHDIFNNREKIFIKFNEYLLKFLNDKFPNTCKNILYADSSRKKGESNYKISLHVVVNNMGTFVNRRYLKKIVLEFSETLPQDIFYKDGKSFVDSEVYHCSQLMRIIYSSNNSPNSVLIPFLIDNNKINYKDKKYISENYELNLCGNYDNVLEFLDIENSEDTYIEKMVIGGMVTEWVKYDTNKIPDWKIKWVKNSNYIKNIYKIKNIIGTKIDLERINFNAYCKLCKRIHERENAFCKVYKNNIMFYCNRNRKGISIGSWYDEEKIITQNENEISLLKKENKELKRKIKELEKEIINIKVNKTSDLNVNNYDNILINNNWYKYYDCGKLLVNNKNDEFRNIICQVWKEGNVSKLKNRCLRIYKLIEYMKENKIKSVKCPLRNIFHLPNWNFENHLKNNLFF